MRRELVGSRVGRFVGTALALLGWVAYLLALTSPAVTQPQQTVVLKKAPGSPLEVVSMQPAAAPAATPKLPERLAKGQAAYDVVVRNQGDVPVMAWSINYVATPDANLGTCAAMMSLSKPLLNPGETTTLREVLYEPGPTITPLIDLVILENGLYYGKNACSTLIEYINGLDGMRTALQNVARRLEKDGPDKTMSWLKQELSRDVKPLLNIKKMKVPE